MQKQLELALGEGRADPEVRPPFKTVVTDYYEEWHQEERVIRCVSQTTQHLDSPHSPLKTYQVYYL